MLTELWQLVRDLPADGAQRLLQLWAQVPAEGMAFRRKTALDRLRQNVWHLHHSWQTHRLTFERAHVPRTNDGSEQAVGRFKSRSEQNRGHKASNSVNERCS